MLKKRRDIERTTTIEKEKSRKHKKRKKERKKERKKRKKLRKEERSEPGKLVIIGLEEKEYIPKSFKFLLDVDFAIRLFSLPLFLSNAKY